MLSRIVVTGLLILAAMIAVQHGALRNLGLAGSCKAEQTLADGSQWVACASGSLSGRPSLESKGCTDSGLRVKLDWWHCPAPVVSTAVGR